MITGHVKNIKGREITIVSDDDLDMLQIAKLSNGKMLSAQVAINDGRHISPDQRKKAWALINDFASYTGYLPQEMEQLMKAEYMIRTGADWFSMTDCSMSTAAGFITAMLDWGFANDIPWTLKTWDMIPTDYYLTIQCLRHRKCIICGKSADIDHVTTVGMGNNRNHIDNRGRYFLPLCRIHHTIRHEMGVTSFTDMYHIKPVKLDDKTIKSLKLNTQAQFDEFDERRSTDGTA